MKKEAREALIGRGAAAGLLHGRDWTVRGKTVRLHSTVGYTPSTETVQTWIRRAGLDPADVKIIGTESDPNYGKPFTVKGTGDPDFFGKNR